MNKLEKNLDYDNKTFEDIKHIDENGIEYWSARELQKVLEYKEWRKFNGIIKRQSKLVKIVELLVLNILSVPTSCPIDTIMPKYI